MAAVSHRPTSAISTTRLVSDRLSHPSDSQALSDQAEGAEVEVVDRDELNDWQRLTTAATALHHPPTLHLIERFLSYRLSQRRAQVALEMECEQLRSEQQMLWRQWMSLSHSKHNQRRLVQAGSAQQLAGSAQDNDGGSVPRPSFQRDDPKGEFIDEEVDEFNDMWISPTPPCRFRDFQRRHQQQQQTRPGTASQRATPATAVAAATTTTATKTSLAPAVFLYGEPDAPGNFRCVLKQGFLYRNITEEGVWAFYNDSVRHVMRARYRFGAGSVLATGPRASLTRLPSGEVEAEVVVLPLQTEILVFGDARIPKNLSVAEPITDASIPNRTVDRQLAAHEEELRELIAAANELNSPRTRGSLPEKIVAVCQRSNEAEAASIKVRFHVLHPDDINMNREGYRYFMDPDFPPSNTSLYREGIDVHFLPRTTWCRPKGYLPPSESSQTRLFCGQVLPIDPSPGYGSDLYLCSAASILAEFPMLVRELFRHPTSAQMGLCERLTHAYRITIGQGGWWNALLIDDFLPASRAGPDFGRSENDLRKLWYPLLQKAYAKVHGSYSAIQGGDPLDALYDFTGCPTHRFDEAWATLDSSACADRGGLKFLNDFFSYFNQGYIVCLSMPETGPTSSKALDMGFMYGMTYYVLDIVRQDGFNLIHLRCPTIISGWDGRWCTESIRWRQQPELARRCGMQRHNELDKDAVSGFEEGIWLDWAEALELFDGGGVCHTRFSGEDLRVKGRFNKGVPSVVLEIRVSRPVEAYAVLSQNDPRGKPADDVDATLAPLMVGVCRPGRPSGEEAPTQYCVECTSSVNPDEGSEKSIFLHAREVAVLYTFRPKELPYYVVPLVHGELSKDYTLGLLPNCTLEDGVLDVRFVRMDPHCPVLQSKRRFACPTLPEPMETSYQIRHMGGIVNTWTGTTARDHLRSAAPATQTGAAAAKMIPAKTAPAKTIPAKTAPAKAIPAKTAPVPDSSSGA